MRDAKEKAPYTPDFREMGKVLDDWNESRFDHKKNSDELVRMAVAMGLDKELTNDFRIPFAFIRGYMLCMKTYRGKLMP